MNDNYISMAEVIDYFGPAVSQAVFDFIGNNRSGLTAQQKRDVLSMMATVYCQGIGVGKQTLRADESEHSLYQKLDRLSRRIAELEKNA